MHHLLKGPGYVQATTYDDPAIMRTRVCIWIMVVKCVISTLAIQVHHPRPDVRSYFGLADATKTLRNMPETMSRTLAGGWLFL